MPKILPAGTTWFCVFRNLIYLILREKLRWTGGEIHFWRTKAGEEIDFVLDFGRCVVPVEVKFSEMGKPVDPTALDGFIEKAAPSACYVVNRNLNATVPVKGCEILFLTNWELLFEEVAQV